MYKGVDVKINLKELRDKAEKATPMRLSQQEKAFTSPEMEYMCSVSNPQTVLALIDALETARSALDLISESAAYARVTHGDGAQSAAWAIAKTTLSKIQESVE